MRRSPAGYVIAALRGCLTGFLVLAGLLLLLPGLCSLAVFPGSASSSGAALTVMGGVALICIAALISIFYR